MWNAATLDRLANVALIASFTALAFSVAMELSNASRSVVSAPFDAQSLLPPARAEGGLVLRTRSELGDFSIFEPTFAVDRDAALPAQLSFVSFTPARVSTRRNAKLASLPAKPGVVFEQVGKKFCIGGTLCEKHCTEEPGGCEARHAYTIRLDRPVHLSALQLYAHDEVGATRRASLLVKVNGEAIGKVPVHRYGSTLTVKIGRVAQLVSVEAMHDTNGFLAGGEEAVIWDIFLLGRAPD